jgi:antitoxin ParD1/3/4/toxin ParE1/3/4
VPRYVLSPEAKDDLREIRDFVAKQAGCCLARCILQEISATFRLLADHPEAVHFRRDLTSLPVKFWPVFSHDLASRPLAIVRALHGRRNVAAILPGGTG